MGIIGNSVSLTLFALFCFTSSVFTLGVNQPGSSAPFNSHPQQLPIPQVTLPPLPPITLPGFPPVNLPSLPPITLPGFPPVNLPSLPPINLPTLPPTKAPIEPPVLPPVSPPKINKTLVAVRGLVYCKPCKYAGVNTLLGAKLVKGAVVRLVCKNKKISTSETKTDKSGNFMLLAPKTVSNYDIKGCRAFLVKSPDAKCSKVSTLHGGDKGSNLKPVMKPGTYRLYNAGPFAFEHTCPK